MKKITTLILFVILVANAGCTLAKTQRLQSPSTIISGFWEGKAYEIKMVDKDGKTFTPLGEEVVSINIQLEIDVKKENDNVSGAITYFGGSYLHINGPYLIKGTLLDNGKLILRWAEFYKEKLAFAGDIAATISTEGFLIGEYTLKAVSSQSTEIYKLTATKK